jgi:hypothetical protein
MLDRDIRRFLVRFGVPSVSLGLSVIVAIVVSW